MADFHRMTSWEPSECGLREGDGEGEGEERRGEGWEAELEPGVRPQAGEERSARYWQRMGGCLRHGMLVALRRAAAWATSPSAGEWLQRSFNQPRCEPAPSSASRPGRLCPWLRAGLGTVPFSERGQQVPLPGWSPEEPRIPAGVRGGCWDPTPRRRARRRAPLGWAEAVPAGCLGVVTSAGPPSPAPRASLFWGLPSARRAVYTSFLLVSEPHPSESAESRTATWQAPESPVWAWRGRAPRTTEGSLCLGCSANALKTASGSPQLSSRIRVAGIRPPGRGMPLCSSCPRDWELGLKTPEVSCAHGECRSYPGAGRASLSSWKCSDHLRLKDAQVLSPSGVSQRANLGRATLSLFFSGFWSAWGLFVAGGWS